MKKKGIVLKMFFVTAIVLFLTGCGNKTVITNDDFIAKAQSNNYTITDVTEEYSSFGNVKSGTVAQSSNDWQVEFYVLTDESNATSMFNTNKDAFESYKSNSSAESSVSMGNYTSYSLTSGGYYMYLCRVDNTLIYARVADTYKDTVKSFIKDLGY